MKRNAIYVFGFLIFLVSCAKDPINNSYNPQIVVVDSAPASIIYQPSTKGSYWQYNTTADTMPGRTIIDSTMVTATGKDTIINVDTVSRVYHIFTSIDSNGLSYRYHFAQDYLYILRMNSYTLTSSSGNVTAGSLKFVYLKDGVDVGNSWTYKLTDAKFYFAGFKIPTQTITSLSETGLTKSVYGKIYNNVSHTHILLQGAVGSTIYTTITSMDFFVAPKIGIIQIETYGQTNKLVNVQRLRKYLIK